MFAPEFLTVSGSAVDLDATTPAATVPDTALLPGTTLDVRLTKEPVLRAGRCRAVAAMTDACAKTLSGILVSRELAAPLLH